MDSGAITHITNNSANLDHVTLPYGMEEIKVGNVAKLTVNQIVIASLLCKHQNSN